MEIENIIEEIICFLEKQIDKSENLPLFSHSNFKSIVQQQSQMEKDELEEEKELEIEQEMREEIYQWIQLHIQEYPLGISKSSYYQDVTQAILEAVYPLWEKENFITQYWKEEDIGQIIYEMVCQFCPKRYTITSMTLETPPTESDLQIWQQKIKILETLDEQNPKQGSTAWLRQRYDMITEG